MLSTKRLTGVLQNRSLIGKLSHPVGIYLGYALVTLVLTYPAYLGLVRDYIIPGAGDHNWHLWDLWWVKHILLDLDTMSAYTTQIWHPFGGPYIPSTPWNELASIPLQMGLSLTRAMTFIWLFAFVTSGFGAYLLSLHFTRNKLVSFIAGLVFAFSTYRWAHALGYFGLHSLQWMPFYALYLFKLLDKPTVRNAVRLTVFLALALVTEYLTYAAYFVILFTFLFLVYNFLTNRKALLNTRFLLAFGLSNLVGWSLMAPVYYMLLSGLQRTFRQSGLITASTDLLGFFIPSPLHPVFGPYVKDEPVGYASYMGYAVLGLVIIALLKKRGRTTTFWLITGLTAMILSLGPVLQCNGLVELEIPAENVKTLIPMPYWLVLLIPFIEQLRAPGRLVATLELALSVLSAYGLQVIWRWLRASRALYKALVFGAITVLILFESLFMFPCHVDTQARIPPAVYEQIAACQDNLAVLELPLNHNRPGYLHLVALYMYYATVHKHPMVGGWGVRTPTEPLDFISTTMFIRELVYAQEAMLGIRDILDNDFFWMVDQGARVLSNYGIGYVVVHRERLEPAEEAVMVYMLERALGPSFYDDGETVAYRVPPPAPQKPPSREKLVIGDGWHSKRVYKGRPARPMRDFGTIFVFEPQPKLARLKLTAFSPGGENTLDLLVNGELIDTRQLTDDHLEPLPCTSRAFPLQAGQNEIAFQMRQAEYFSQTLIQIGAFFYAVHLETALQADDVAISHPRRVNLADQVALIGYDLEPHTLQPGDVLRLTLYWQGLDVMDQSYTVFAHLTDEAGHIWAQKDGEPSLPTRLWGVDEVIEDSYDLLLPQNVPAGRYQLKVGMYAPDTMQRLAARDEHGQALTDNSVPLCQVEVER